MTTRVTLPKFREDDLMVDGKLDMPHSRDVSFYRVIAEYGPADNTGACSFAATYSYEDALADLAQQKVDPENAKYERWGIMKFEPRIISSIVHRENK